MGKPNREPLEFAPEDDGADWELEAMTLAPPSELGADLSTLTNDRIERLCYFLKRGLTERVAAYQAHLDPDSVLEWLMEGRTADARPMVRQLYAQVGFATGQLQLRHLGQIDKMGGKGSIWFLQTRFTSEWGQAYRNDVQVTVKDDRGSPTAGLDSAEIRALLGRVEHAVETSSGGVPQITMTQTTQTLTIGPAPEEPKQIEATVIDAREDGRVGDGD